MLPSNHSVDDFPALQMVRTGRIVRLVGKLTFLAIVCSLAAMLVLPWRQTAPGKGVVIALDPQQRPQPMLSQSEGIISYVEPGLREGSYVEKGDLLLRMTPFAIDGVKLLDSQINSLESKREAFNASLSVARNNETSQIRMGEALVNKLQNDLEAAKRKWEQAKNDVVAKEAKLEDTRNKLRVAERVFPNGLIPQEELFTKRRAVETEEANVTKAKNYEQEIYAALAAKENEIESEKEDIFIKNQEARNKVLEAQGKINTVDKEISELMNKRSEADRLEIFAPRSGYIQQWSVREGSDSIKKGEQLFVIVPEADELAVEMKVNGNDMPLIHEGDWVRLQFEGWPAVQFVGWPSVAVGSFGGKVNRVYPTDDGNGFFRVIVTPDNHFQGEDGWPDRRYLRQGVRANGWILLERVRLGYEIWRQLNGFPKELSQDDTSSEKPEKGKKVKLPKS